MKKIIIIIAIVIVILAVASYFLFIKQPKEPDPVVVYYTPGDFFVTNIKDSDYLLKVTIVLELNQEGKESYLTKHNHIIRDVIIFTLREKNLEELSSMDIQDTLRNEIITRINQKLDIDYIVALYFNDYVFQ